MVKSKGAKRGKNRKAKKRLAVHIKEANGKRAAAATGDDQGVAHRGPLLASPLGVGRPSAGNKRPRQTDPARTERDRSDAIVYLSAWAASRKSMLEGVDSGAERAAGGGGGASWKFNKNTQAWLLRNMFGEEEMAASSFDTMCLYLEGLKGVCRQRVLEQAQEIIEKHGPREEHEKEVVSEPAQITPPPGSRAETAKKGEIINFDDDPAPAAAPSGYNSDSSTSSSSDDENAAPGEESDKRGLNGKEAGKSSTPGAKPSVDPSKEMFAFGFSHTAASIDGGNEQDVTKKAVKRKRKERVALTGDAKAEGKAQIAVVSFERALRVAEVLA